MVIRALFLCFIFAAVVNGSDFLRNPPPNFIGLENPKILSIGCGKVAQVEVDALKKYFANFSYQCVEADARKVKSYTRQDQVTIMHADASNMDLLQSKGLVLNVFDVVIVRHPDFHTFGEPFAKIFRRVIPSYLKKGGILVVSILNDQEKIFFTREVGSLDHENINTLLMDFQYNLLSEDKLEQPTTPSLGFGSFLDSRMFYFQNIANLTDEQEIFKIDIKEAEIPFFERIIPQIGGIVIGQAPLMIQINRTYIERIAHYYRRAFTEVQILPCANPSCHGGTKQLQCSRCKSVKYCSSACQLANWPAHKNICQAK